MDVKRGVIRSFDAGSYTATVQVEDSPGCLGGVLVNRGLAAASIVAGRWCVVVFFDATHPEDGMVVGVY